MSFLRFFSRWRIAPELLDGGIPRIKFDKRLITQAIEDEIRWQIDLLPDVSPDQRDTTYATALKAFRRGGDLSGLTNFLVNAGLPKDRAGGISRYLWSHTQSHIQQARWLSLGIEEFTWLYSGAACTRSGSSAADDADRRQDNEHRSANGQVFSVASGLMVNGKSDFPGRNDGCKCVGIPVGAAIHRAMKR